MNILAIDPGTTESAFVCWDGENIGPFKKLPNNEILEMLKIIDPCNVVIEMIASYGMPVGKEVFETCLWIGRFMQAYHDPDSVSLMYRKDVKLNICNSPRANDTTIRKALIDRFAYQVPNHGKGYKKAPGFFYGFKTDVWAAFAVAVTYYDMTIDSRQK